jgi:hypothetical protein
MLGRRSYARVTLGEGAEGTLCLARDIGVTEQTDGEWIATSREAGVIGETVLVALLDEGVTLQARIVESKPLVTDGAVRHRLCLRKIDADPSDADATTQER